MSAQLKKGDKVTWKTSQGETSGTVKKKLTSPTDQDLRKAYTYSVL
ncbi:DUF2945 domain-containing protein [Coleofasciculus sp. H7-2]